MRGARRGWFFGLMGGFGLALVGLAVAEDITMFNGLVVKPDGFTSGVAVTTTGTWLGSGSWIEGHVTSTTGLTFTGSGSYFESDPSTASVAPSGKGRIRYTTADGWQISSSTTAWVDVATPNAVLKTVPASGSVLLTSAENNGLVLASAAAVITLPTGQAGYLIRVVSMTSGNVDVVAQGTDTIRNLGVVSIAGGRIRTSVNGAGVTLVSTTTGTWAVFGSQGPWGIDP